MNVEEPLDFEFEDPLATPTPTPNPNRRKKFIGLDDLLNEYYKEKEKSELAAKKFKNLKRKQYDSEDDEDDAHNERERELFKLVGNCQDQVTEMSSEDNIRQWGLLIFGEQKQCPKIDSINLQSCNFMQHFSSNQDFLPFQLNIEEDCFIEGLLLNGWLMKLVSAQGYLEDSIGCWTFYQMLYSSNEKLHSSACNFWCEILQSNEVKSNLSDFHWFKFSKLRESLEIYGYLLKNANNLPHLDLNQPGNTGLPLNLRSWLRFLNALCQSRVRSSVLSNSETEELLSIVISFFLDRRIQGIFFLLDECLRSIICSFTDEQWLISCGKVAKSFASRIPKDLNCLRTVESISLASPRCKNLRSELAFQILIHCFAKQVTGAKEVLKSLASVNLKDEKCDFVKLYIYAVLVENWLCVNPPVDDKSVILQLWHKYLRNCSTQITSTDWRPYASKVRNRASYLLQTTNS